MYGHRRAWLLTCTLLPEALQLSEVVGGHSWGSEGRQQDDDITGDQRPVRCSCYFIFALKVLQLPAELARLHQS